jgi:hypothetical protein
MKFTGTLSALALLLATGVMIDANAADPSPAQIAQRERMTNCNKEAKIKALKGDERKAFMRECLSSGKKEAAAEKPAEEKPAKVVVNAEEKEKIKACRKEATEKKLKGDARKAFVSQCLEG